ncbi:hypothetical protein AA313_de0206105 [Arthrobotrys entomopaga]|nr:hypothetical protein AA313_de0206105 [Arthrobotrys entomopaga]
MGPQFRQPAGTCTFRSPEFATKKHRYSDRSHPTGVTETGIAIVAGTEFITFPAGNDKYELSNTGADHGSKVAAKIVGRKTGIAPDASIVFVPRLDGSRIDMPTLVLNAYLKIYDHIVTVNGNSPCIINHAFSISFEAPAVLQAFQDVLSAISKLPNVIFVAFAGNRPPGTPIVNIPHILSKDFKNFVSVGVVDENFQNMAQYDDVTYKNTVWGPDVITVIKPADPRVEITSESDYYNEYFTFRAGGGTSGGK